MSPPLPQHKVLQEAANWFATLSDERVSEQEKNQWQSWLDQHPDHRQAWCYVENISQRFNVARQQAGASGTSTILNNSRTERIKRRQLMRNTMAVMFGSWLGWQYTPLPEVTARVAHRWRADHYTGIGDVRELALDDGGKLWLNTDTALDVHYSAGHRNLLLHTGEIYIETAVDPQQRPFTVTSQHGQIRAIGTGFTVRQYNADTRVSVFEGAVEITTRSGLKQRLNAGQQTLFNAHTIAAEERARPGQKSWSQGVIVAEDMTVQQLLDELGRYHKGHIGLHPALSKLRVTGTYPLHQPHHVLAMLENTLPLKVSRIFSWWITLEPTP